MNYVVNSTVSNVRVLEAQSPTIKRFWERMLPAQNSELPCLHQWQEGKYHPTSYKDVHAQAQCVAGYLMRRGLQHGDHVGLMGQPGLRYHVMNLALQYLGAVNVTIPQGFTTEQIDALGRRYRFRLLFVDSATQFLALGEFPDMKEQLLCVVIGEDEVDALDPDKIVTYDRVVTLGKSAWREEANELKARKNAVLTQDIYSILLDEEGKTQNVRMEQWMAAVDQAEKSLLSSQVKNLLSTLTPDRLLWRAYGFAAISNQVPWWIHPSQHLQDSGFLHVKPEMILTDPVGVRNLYDMLPALIDQPEKGRRAIVLALEVVRKRDEANSAGKKDPLMNRFKYSTSNRKLYKRIRAKLGGRVTDLICDKGVIDADHGVLLREVGIKIAQP